MKKQFLALFTEETLDLLNQYRPGFDRIKCGKPVKNDIDTFLRLVHSIEGTSANLQLSSLSLYCQKLEAFLLKSKDSYTNLSMAQVALMVEAHNLLKDYLERLQHDNNTSFEPGSHLTKLEKFI